MLEVSAVLPAVVRHQIAHLVPACRPAIDASLEEYEAPSRISRQRLTVPLRGNTCCVSMIKSSTTFNMTSARLGEARPASRSWF